MIAQTREILAVCDIGLRRDRVAARAVDDLAIGGRDRQRVELRDAGHLGAQQTEGGFVAGGLAQCGSRGDALRLDIGGDVIEHDADTLEGALGLGRDQQIEGRDVVEAFVELRLLQPPQHQAGEADDRQRDDDRAAEDAAAQPPITLRPARQDRIRTAGNRRCRRARAAKSR